MCACVDLSRSLNCSQFRYAPCLNVAGAPRKRRASNCKQIKATIKQQQAAICLKATKSRRSGGCPGGGLRASSRAPTPLPRGRTPEGRVANQPFASKPRGMGALSRGVGGCTLTRAVPLARPAHTRPRGIKRTRGWGGIKWRKSPGPLAALGECQLP